MAGVLVVPEFAVVRGQSWRDRVEVRMAAGLNISRPRSRIGEIDSARVTAHDRTRLIDMWQAEGMAQFVRDYVKQHLARSGLAVGFRRAETDSYGQANNTTLIGVDLRFAHFVRYVRVLVESNDDIGASFFISPGKRSLMEYSLEDVVPLGYGVVDGRVEWFGRCGRSINCQRKTLSRMADQTIFNVRKIGGPKWSGRRSDPNHHR
jgi:hypothetical protein